MCGCLLCNALAQETPFLCPSPVQEKSLRACMPACFSALLLLRLCSTMPPSCRHAMAKWQLSCRYLWQGCVLCWLRQPAAPQKLISCAVLRLQQVSLRAFVPCSAHCLSSFLHGIWKGWLWVWFGCRISTPMLHPLLQQFVGTSQLQ